MTIDPTEGELLQSYLPLYSAIPDKWEDARIMLVEALKRISTAVNSREIGSYIDEELLTGRQFVPGINQNPTTVPYQFRDVFRKVIVFGGLPNATTKTMAHNIVVDVNFSLVNFYLSATDPTALDPTIGSFSLQYWSISVGDIILGMTNTNVVVTTLSNYSRFTRSFIVIEYMQQL